MQLSQETVTIIALSAAGVSTVAAVISARNANKALAYSKQKGMAAISLLDGSVTVARPAPERINIRLVVVFENVGEESLQISEIKTGYFEFQRENFTKLTEDHALVNTIHAGAIFNQPLSVYVEVEPSLKDEQVNAFLSDSLVKLGFVIVLNYEGKRSGPAVEKYYLGYKGGRSKSYQLTNSEYLEMESHLPPQFKRSGVGGLGIVRKLLRHHPGQFST